MRRKPHVTARQVVGVSHCAVGWESLGHYARSCGPLAQLALVGLPPRVQAAIPGQHAAKALAQ
jgi:hypothetical protein